MCPCNDTLYSLFLAQACPTNEYHLSSYICTVCPKLNILFVVHGTRCASASDSRRFSLVAAADLWAQSHLLLQQRMVRLRLQCQCMSPQKI